MKIRRILLFVVLVSILMGGEIGLAKSKVLYVESYHQGYPWSDGIRRGVYETLGYKIDPAFNVLNASDSTVILKVHAMDTKRFTGMELPSNASPEDIQKAKDLYSKEAAKRAKEVIDTWQPDVVIASDDHASKYLIKPYYRGGDLPFVFCGLNWDASLYGLPCDNVTGMVEVALIPSLIKTMKPYAQGDRLGFLGGNSTTDHKEVAHLLEVFDLEFQPVLAEDFNAWQEGFLKLQDEVDMIILHTTSAVKHFDLDEACAFVNEQTKIPTGCIQQNERTLALVGYTKSPHEQGTWAARTALRILAGTSPKDIPVVTNRKADVYLNLSLAEKLGVHFPLALVKKAQLVRSEPEVAAAN